jgi:hypothetical protein
MTQAPGGRVQGLVVPNANAGADQAQSNQAKSNQVQGSPAQAANARGGQAKGRKGQPAANASDKEHP